MNLLRKSAAKQTRLGNPRSGDSKILMRVRDSGKVNFLRVGPPPSVKILQHNNAKS